MAITPGVIVAAAAEELPKIFNDAVQNERRGQPDYIANGTPESIIGQIAQATSRAACRNYGAQSASVQAEAAAQYETACRPYLDDIAPGNGAGIAVPFEGGQCNGELYYGSFSYDSGNGSTTAYWKAYGPIGGFVAGENSSGAKGYGVVSRGHLYRTGTPYTCGGLPPTLRESSYAQFVNGEDFEDISLTVSGSCAATPGDCGNPPPVVRQPTDQPDPIGRPFRFNPTPDVDIDIDVTVGPTGDITVDFGTGPITIDPFGGGDGGDGGGGGGGGANPTPGDPGDSQDTGGGGGGGGGGGDAGGDAPAGKVLTGVKVEILESPPSRRRFTDEVDRGVCYVYMGTPTEGLGLEPTGATVRDGQFFFAQRDYLTRWEVRANFGYNLRTTPYYKDAPE